MNKTIETFAIIAAATLCPSLVLAAGPDLNPGKWQFDTTVVMSMSPEPTQQSETKCITKEEAESDPLASIVEQGRCKVLSKTESGNSLNFEIECEGDANMKMKMRGKGTFTGDGDSAAGKMDMTMEMPKMPNMPNMPNMGTGMNMSQTWTGKRLGACD